MIEGYSTRQLGQRSRHSQRKLYRSINYWLDHVPSRNHSNLSNIRCTIFDGTFLHRPDSIVVLMDARSNTVIKGEYGVRENSKSHLLSFFTPLQNKGFSPKACTVDGNPQVIKILRELWPQIVIQRCLVHIQRQGLMWCRQNPRRPDAKSLRRIFRLVTTIHTRTDRDRFIRELTGWEQRYGRIIDAHPERGRVFSDLKRARSMLIKALPDMFYYLDDPNIPFTTNSLEGYFSRLKRHYRNHRGLKPIKRSSYFNWYFFLRPK